MNKKTKFPPIHHYSSRNEWIDACWREIAKSENLLGSLITPYERRNLVIRAAASERIHVGKSYQQIADELWLSPQTISSIKKAIYAESYRSYRERGKTERKKKDYSSAVSRKRKPRGKPVRTKYGVIHLPRL